MGIEKSLNTAEKIILLEGLAQQGYSIKPVDPASDAYKRGLQFMYIVPDNIALKQDQYTAHASSGKEPTTVVSLTPSKEFMIHASQLTVALRTRARALQCDLANIEVSFIGAEEKDRKQVIYFSLK